MTDSMAFRSPTVAELHDCLTAPPRTGLTPRGEVEYAIRGNGPALLSVHGSPGGYQEGLLMAELFRANGFGVIAPSRPGYGGTPLSTGRTPAEQADAMAGLLDALGVERAAVFGMSGGGPASYALAARHPERVICLLEVDAISVPLAGSRLERLAFSQRPLVALQLWLLDHMPRSMLKVAGSTEDADAEIAASKIELLRDIVVSVSDWSKCRAGYDNDDEQFADLDDLPLHLIRCPTLIMHATTDRSVPAEHAERAHAAIADSDLRWMPVAAHVAFFTRSEAQQYALDWLRGRLTG